MLPVLYMVQVIRAAIFDLLTSQCDRHAQNIFVNEHGQIKLIDNEAALQSNWKNCAVNSILVPTTQVRTLRFTAQGMCRAQHALVTFWLCMQNASGCSCCVTVMSFGISCAAEARDCADKQRVCEQACDA